MTAVVERAPVPAASGTATRSRRPSGRLGLGLAVVAAIVLALLLGQRALAERFRAQDRADVMSASRQMAINFSTLSYQSFDQDTARVVAGSTGAFRSDFTAQAAQIKKVVLANKSVSAGQVGPVAVVSSGATRARTLVVLDASITNTSSAKPTARHYRVQLDLQKVHGRWLVSQLQFVG